MATKVKPTRLNITGTPQAWDVPQYVDGDNFQWWTWWGGGDVTWPVSSTDWNIAVFDWATGKIIKDGWTALTAITGVIPSEATSSNKLADKNYVNDGINSVTAYYITKNANGDQFATYAELNAATTFYSGWVQRTPTRNDYCIVQADENHDNATTRYIYNASWEYQYTVNETALTTAQLNALNSGITAAKVSTYDGYASTISWKQDALTLPATPTQWHLVTRWANNKSLTDWWAVPTVPTNVSSFVNDAGYVTASDFEISTVVWATLTISYFTTQITPSADFTLVAWMVKEWMQYIIRVNSWATVYTMSLGTGVTNPFWEDLTLIASKTTTVILLATSSSTLEIFGVRTAS